MIAAYRPPLIGDAFGEKWGLNMALAQCIIETADRPLVNNHIQHSPLPSRTLGSSTEPVKPIQATEGIQERMFFHQHRHTQFASQVAF
jgi:hypothetical protein